MLHVFEGDAGRWPRRTRSILKSCADIKEAKEAEFQKFRELAYIHSYPTKARFENGEMVYQLQALTHVPQAKEHYSTNHL